MMVVVGNLEISLPIVYFIVPRSHGGRAVIPGLTFVLIAMLIGPIFIRPIERNIELFFLSLGVFTTLLTGQFGLPMLRAAATEPVALTAAVLVFGLVGKLARSFFDDTIKAMRSALPARFLYLILIGALGLLSTVITAVVAALLLVEAMIMLKVDRESEVAVVVLSCFAIGLGSGLTPTGGPLAAIAISAIGADFWYLVRLLWPFVLGGILIVSILGMFVAPASAKPLHISRTEEHWSDIVLRALRVYLFVAGLVGLSWGLRPLVAAYIDRVPQTLLFWINSISAIVDNAALTAAEMSPSLGLAQQRAALMGLLISGGMLIPGNIPNIVAANRLGISSREWARVGLVTGLPLMALCFVLLFFTR
jgi:predicted cation transporter